MSTSTPIADGAPDAGGLMALMTRERWIEMARIVVTGLIALLFWRGLVPIQVLWVAIAIGLYPLVKTGILDLIHKHKVGTEIFVTVATLVAVFGGETVAGAVLMVIILIAEFIAELNTDRARASIKSLIGSVPQVALLRTEAGERSVPVAELKIGDVVLVRPGEKIPVDGRVVGGQGSVNEAPITGESIPKDKAIDAQVFAGTVVDSGALDIRTERLGTDTTFSRIIALVESDEVDDDQEHEHDGDQPSRHLVGQLLHRRCVGLGGFDKRDDAGEGGVGAEPLGADIERAGIDHGAEIGRAHV